MARKKAIAKRKPKTKTKTIVKYRTRRVPVKRRRTVGRRSTKLTQAKNTLLTPVIGTAVASGLKSFTGLDEFIEKTPGLKFLGYDFTVALAMIALGSVSNKHRKMLYSASVGPLCIGVDKLIEDLAKSAKVAKDASTSGFYSDELSEDL